MNHRPNCKTTWLSEQRISSYLPGVGKDFRQESGNTNINEKNQ